MLTNMKLGLRLGIGFGVLFVLVTIMALFSITQLKKIEGDVDLVASDRIPKTRMANDIIDQVSIVARAIRNMALLKEKDRIEKERNRIEEAGVIVTAKLDTLTGTITSEEGKKKLQAVIDARKAYMIPQKEIQRLIGEGKTEAAVALLLGEFRQLQGTYLDALNTMTSFQTDLAQNDAHHAVIATRTVVTVLIIVSIAILLIGVIVAVFITRSITAPIGKCVTIAQKIAAGDTSVDISDAGKDEVGVLMENMREMVTSIRNMMADAEMLSKAAVAGKLATRAEASKHQGDFRMIVQGVNDTLDAVIGPLNVAAEYIDRISKGDIPPKITDSYNGDFNEIKNNLNVCIDALNGVLGEMKNMSEQHTLGDIDVVIPVDKFQGAYRTMASGVNEMVTGHIAVKKKAMACIAEFGKGNFGAPLEKFPGKKAFINETIEKMRDNLKAFIAQMRHMSEQHNLGDIDVVIPANSFEGDYSVMAQGVNEMVMGHIAVKKKAMACIAEFGKGNFDAPLEKFPGKKAFINETIEGVRANLKAIVEELSVLILASKDGALSTRGNANAYQGDWRNMVQGVNEILDAILEPINEAAGVLDKVADRDMTARVKGEYKGDHAKIKNAINTAVDNLDSALTQVAEATEQVSSGSQQISAGSQSLAQGANEQAGSLEEVSSSLEEMASMTKQNAENAGQANNLAGEANSNAALGAEAMSRMNLSITKIKESSDQTAKIVKTIDEIAMQTNLLALNAAVEAARAGEAGRGFAVVAEEVRNLAQRSADAAKNTANMIEESVKNAEDGVRISSEVSKSFELIAGSAKKVNDLIAEIAAASQEQSTGIDQVNLAVAQMDKVTQQNAANSEESASAAEEMSSQAEELQGMIAQFNLTQSVQKKVTVQSASKGSHLAHADSTRALAMHKTGFAKRTGKGVEAVKAQKRTAEEIIPLEDDLSQF